MHLKIVVFGFLIFLTHRTVEADHFKVDDGLPETKKNGITTDSSSNEINYMSSDEHPDYEVIESRRTSKPKLNTGTPSKIVTTGRRSSTTKKSTTKTTKKNTSSRNKTKTTNRPVTTSTKRSTLKTTQKRSSNKYTPKPTINSPITEKITRPVDSRNGGSTSDDTHSHSEHHGTTKSTIQNIAEQVEGIPSISNAIKNGINDAKQWKQKIEDKLYNNTSTTAATKSSTTKTTIKKISDGAKPISVILNALKSVISDARESKKAIEELISSNNSKIVTTTSSSFIQPTLATPTTEQAKSTINQPSDKPTTNKSTLEKSVTNNADDNKWSFFKILIKIFGNLIKQLVTIGK